MNKPIFDLHSLSEADRLKLIAEAASLGITGVLLEKKGGKVERYIREVLQLNPQARHLDTTPATKGVVLVRFAPKATH